MMSILTGVRGLLSALATSLIVLGALSLSLAEGMVLSAPTSQPEPTLPPVNLTPLPEPSPADPSPTARATATQRATVPVLVTPTEDLSGFCQQPSGWEVYVIQPGDTLESLAAERRIPLEQLMAGNCLVSPQVMHGTFLYVPVFTPTPTVTNTGTRTVTVRVTKSLTATPVRVSSTPKVIYPSPVPCGPFPGWLRYRVQKGDTLFSLSRELKTSVSQLQHANCMGTSTLIRAGDWLWVPRIPHRTSTPTRTPTHALPAPTGTITTSPTSTNTVTATATPTSTQPVAPPPILTPTEADNPPEPPSG